MVAVLGIIPISASAESPSPSVHWGAIAYPDQARLLDAGFTLNRFTEFNVSRDRYNAINETAGFNFATISWSEHLKALPGWSSNLTIGAGPTRDDPTNSIQNRNVHRWLGFKRVPVDAVREANDFMFDGSVTRWISLFGAERTGFAGGGLSTGSVYQELYARAGMRRVALADIIHIPPSNGSLWTTVLRSIRLSGMGRYSRLWSGAAYHEVAPQSFFAQGSIAVGDYSKDPFRPVWELEFAYSIDSGLFVNFSGSTIEEQFGSVALRIGFFTFESWNDSINKHDNGPTFGGKATVDVFRLIEYFRKT
ncbi:MAG TPA: hypothetical protein VHQ67_04650 [Nitrospiraceae bacterium]|nr:hypothetical protein [Nitrospiraceae bacterium]